MARAVVSPAGVGDWSRDRASSILSASPARRHPVVTRRRLQLALALLWLLDGALQLQPFMFTRGFADLVIAPTAAGQPAFVVAAVHWSAALVLGHRVAADVLFAAVQLAIGAGLCFRRTARPAVAASVVWAIGVWVFGEGLGGLAGGTATLLTGAPGAVLLYALLGMAAWPRLGVEGRTALASTGASLPTRLGVLFTPGADERPARWLPGAWAGLWGLFALLQILPANDSPRSVANQLQANASSAPGWLAHADRVLATAARHAGAAPLVALVVLEVAIGLLGMRSGRLRRLAAAAGVLVALGAWVLGQAFGQIPTGMGTDPNAGPLVALLGIALLGCPATRRTRATTRSGALGRAGDGPGELPRRRPEAA